MEHYILASWAEASRANALVFALVGERSSSIDRVQVELSAHSILLTIAKVD